MKDIKMLVENADKVIALAKQIEAFGEACKEEHLRIAIMAGIADAESRRDNNGLDRR